MNYKNLSFFFLTLFISSQLLAQDKMFNLDANLFGNFYSQKESPFWMHSNKRGRIDEKSTLSAWVNSSTKSFISNSSYIEGGMGFLYHNGYSNEIQLDEMFIRYTNPWLEVTVGAKQSREVFSGLSASNSSILWSLNARPVPGLLFRTAKPVFFFGNKGFGFTASYGEYILGNDRYVDNVHVHHKSFNLVYKYSKFLKLSVGLQHYAQWAGTSPDFGDLPDSFNDYLKVFLGKGAESVGDQEVNSLGNQIGSYEVNLETRINEYKIHFIYNHLFEDGSGRMLFNTPDGRYGLYVEDDYPLNENWWFKAVMYEFYYTRDQSEGSGTTDGDDNYFSNNLYRSGWSYYSRVIGMPFITMNEERTRVHNNTLVAHHLGLAGMAYSKYPYKLLNSYRINYGNKGNDVLDNMILSSFLEVEIYNTNGFNINVQLGADFISDSPTNLGAGILLSKRIY